MNEFIAQLQDQFSRVWANLNTQQRVIFIAAPVVLVLALIVAVYLASRPDYVQLVSDSDLQRLEEIRNYLETNNVTHEVKGKTRNLLKSLQ